MSWESIRYSACSPLIERYWVIFQRLRLVLPNIVKEINPEPRQVHLDPFDEPRRGSPLEVVIHQKRDLAGLKGAP